LADRPDNSPALQCWELRALCAESRKGRQRRSFVAPRSQAPAWERACLRSSASMAWCYRARPLYCPLMKRSFTDNCVPKLELGNEAGSASYVSALLSSVDSKN
jgi:hypothetical protein